MHETCIGKSSSLVPTLGDRIIVGERAPVLARSGLVRATEPDEVRSDDTEPGVHQDWDHVAIEKAPSRLAVHAQDDRTVGWAFFDVVDAKRPTVPIRHLLGSITFLPLTGPTPLCGLYGSVEHQRR
jgi:hypothetical protein